MGAAEQVTCHFGVDVGDHQAFGEEG